MASMTKKWLLSAILIALICLVLFSLTACSGEGLFGSYETQSFDISDDFEDILIEIDTAEVNFLLSQDDACHVVAYAQKNINYDARVDNGTLKISVSDDREWYEYVQIGFESSFLVVYLPKTEYSALALKASTSDVLLSGNFKFDSIDMSVSTGDLNVSASARGAVSLKASTGDIDLSDMSASYISITVSTGEVDVDNVICDGDFELAVSTGDAEIKNMTCNNFSSTEGDTGNLKMDDVIAAEKITVVRSTGSVTLYACDAEELDIETDTGDVKGVLLTSKIFIVRTDTGRINVPETTEGGKCKVITSTGNIKLEIIDSKE